MQEPCTCPGDYHTYLLRADGTVVIERHHAWCPASTQYIPRLHWHDRACYAQGTLSCGKRAGVDPR